MLKRIKYHLQFKNLPSVVYLLFVVSNFVLFCLLKQETKDTVANESKSSFPTFDSSGFEGFAKQVDSYFTDNFPLKYKYISFANNIKVDLLNSLNSSNSVIIGKGDWLFYNACVYDSLGMNEYTGNKSWNRKQLFKVIKNINAMASWCQKNNIQFEVIICPNKQTVYADYLPDVYKKTHDNRYDQLMNGSPGLINLKNLFLNFIKKCNQPLYYKTDTHWNHFGAYLAAAQLYERLQKHYPIKNFYRIELKNYVIPIGLDLANTLALKNSYSDTGDSITFKIPPTYKIPHLVIVHDSYLGSMDPALEYLFGRITKRHLYNEGIPSPQYLKDNHTDVFVIELVERYKELLTGDIHPDYFR